MKLKEIKILNSQRVSCGSFTMAEMLVFKLSLHNFNVCVVKDIEQRRNFVNL